MFRTMFQNEYKQYAKNIKYLLKFIDKKYVTYLLTKGLYMNQINYFTTPRHNSDGQYDCWESLSSGKLRMYKNRNRPIWCCTTILYDDINDNTIKFDKRLLKDFFKNNINDGRLVLLDFEKFIDKIYQYPDEYEMVFGQVDYYTHPKQIGERFLSGEWADCIFLKSSKYSYQNEFRVANARVCEIKTERKKVFNCFDCDVLTSDNPYIPYEYYLPDLQAISKVYSTEQLSYKDNVAFLKIQ